MLTRIAGALPALDMQTGAELGLPLTWTDFDETPIMFANHVVVQHQPDEFVLSLSQVVGPPLTGTDVDRREQATGVDHLNLHTLARVAMNRRRVVELISLLQAEVQEHDRLIEAQQGG
jgi:hypothetical protein